MYQNRFAGTIEACFYDFVEKYPGLPYLQFLADFCRVDLERVQRWQRRDYFPTGADRLSIGCAMDLLGYDVTELYRLSEPAQVAAYLVSLDIVKPDAMKSHLGYLNTQSMWRFFLFGEGTSQKVRDKIIEITRKKKGRLQTKLTAWKERADSLFGSPGDSTEEKEAAESGLTFTPEMAAAFARVVGAASALAQIFVTAEQPEAAQQATAGGRDMHELIELLQKLTA